MNTFGFVVVDRRTGAIVARCKTREGALRSVDRRDNEYGAYRFYARAAMPSEAPGFKRSTSH
jgi:hypothetical protein